jgi:serine/threonine protein kinase
VDEPGFETRAQKATIRRALFGHERARVGRFEIVRTLGRGGMGVVYEAWDEVLGRHIALKVFDLERLDDERPDAEQRLLLEARALARLRHPNVLPVYDAGVHERCVYIAMELVEGGHAGRWAERLPGPSPTRFAAVLDVILQAAAGLGALHAAGLVHRDFKPSNLLIDAQGRAVVADLGLARPDKSLVAPALVATDRADDRTSSSAASGTPRYMAPEQQAGAALSVAVDVYACCFSLAELLVGPAGILASSRAELLAVLRTVGVPRRLAGVVDRGLADDPRARPADMVELADELRRAVGPRRRAQIVGWAAAAALAAAAIGSAWSSSPDLSPAPQAARIEVELGVER